GPIAAIGEIPARSAAGAETLVTSAVTLPGWALFPTIAARSRRSAGSSGRSGSARPAGAGIPMLGALVASNPPWGAPGPAGSARATRTFVAAAAVAPEIPGRIPWAARRRSLAAVGLGLAYDFIARLFGLVGSGLACGRGGAGIAGRSLALGAARKARKIEIAVVVV